MKKFSTKIVSIMLSIAIVLVSLPLTVFAVMNDKNKTHASSSDNTDLGSVVSDIYELTDRRDEYTKHFRLEDGSVVAAQYNDPIHLLDENGDWQDIDNTLSDVGSEYSTGNTRIKFVKKITGNESLFTLHDGNTKLSLSLDGAVKKTEGIVENHTGTEASMTKLQKMMSLEKISSNIVYEDILNGIDLEYIVRSNYVKENIIVKEKQDGYSYTFTMKLNNLKAALKEDGSVAIADPDTNETVYAIPAPIVYDDASSYAPSDLAYYSLTQVGENKYLLTVTVDSAWMNADERAYPVVIDPTVYKGGYKLGQMRDTFVSSKKPTSGNGGSTELRVGYDATYGYTRSYVYLHPKPVLPAGSYITSARINLQVKSNHLSDNILFGAYTIDMGTSSVWSESGTTWNSHPTQFDELLDYNLIEMCLDLFFCSWDVTEAAKKWYDGSLLNQGICIGLLEESGDTENYISFYASEYAMGSVYMPYYTFTYRDAKGIEGYYSYFEAGAGLAGSVGINYATGNLVLTKALLSTTDSLISYAPTLVYNSALANLPYKYSDNVMTAYTAGSVPYGFKLSTQETLIKKSYIGSDNSTEYHYIWADADGTEHYFRPVQGETEKYRDEDGLQLILDCSSDTVRTMTDDSKTVKTFEKMATAPSGTSEAWYLVSIADVNGNAVSFGYDTSQRLSSVSIIPNGFQAIEFLTLSYNSSGMPYIIYNSASKDAIIFRYSSSYAGDISTSNTKYLRQLVYAHGNSNVTDQNWLDFYNDAASATNITVDATVSYSYDSAGRMIQASDLYHGYCLDFTYTGGKVSTVREFGQNASVGQTVGFSYYRGFSESRVSGSDDIYGNSDDIITVYTFDDNLRVVSSYSTDVTRKKIYGAASGEYETQESVKNNIKSSAVVGGSSVNHLVNGSFELSSNDATELVYWQQSSNVNRLQLYDIEETGWHVAEFAVKPNVTDSINQYVFLKAGTYTLSMDLTTVCAEDATVYVRAIPVNSGRAATVEQFSVNRIYASQTTEISLDFDAFEYSNSGEGFKIVIEVVGGSSVSTAATVRVDNVVLEKSIGRSSYSLVEFGNFEDFSRTELGIADAVEGDFWTTQDGTPVYASPVDDYFGESACVIGDAHAERYIKQRIYSAPQNILDSYGDSTVTGENDRVYIVSGFAKAVGILKVSAFRLRVEVNYYNGPNEDLTTHTFCYDFNRMTDAWQFVCGTFDTTDGDIVHSIDLYCDFYYYADARAYFDNISVVQSGIGEVESYAYYGEDDENKDGLLRVKINGSYYEYYEYDDNRNLTRVANNRGEICDYVYDAEGKNVREEIRYTFVNVNGGIDYPLAEDPDLYITKTAKTVTEYTRNSCGLVTATYVSEAENSATGAHQKPGGTRLVYGQTYNLGNSSRIFGSVAEETDERGVTTIYYYNQDNGRLNAVINKNTGNGVSYTYDALGNMLTAIPATYYTDEYYTPLVSDDNELVDYDYSSGQLSAISTRSTEYVFGCDSFGNSEYVFAGTYRLAYYTYASNNGKLSQVAYGNGTYVRYVYDELDNVKGIWYSVYGENEILAYEYTYTASGQVSEIKNNLTGRNTQYKYDTDGRLTNLSEYDTEDMKNNFGIRIKYDGKSRVDSTVFSLDYALANGYEYTYLICAPRYDNQDKLVNYSILSDSVLDGDISYSYDIFDRIHGKTYNYTNEDGDLLFTNTTGYTYAPYGDGTTSLIGGYTVKVGSGAQKNYTYTYDSNGYITHIYLDGVLKYSYTYDKLGQLTRENNVDTDETYLYYYDNAGNITVKSTHYYAGPGQYVTSPYEYEYYGYTNEWGDLLTSYSGTNLTYDGVGNPLSYYNGASYTFTWSQGRRLATASKSGYTLSFEYNDEGIRTSKTVNGVEHVYYLNGSQILAEEWGNNLIIYLYDAEGSPVGMQYRSSTYGTGIFDLFFFEHNLQGDIVAVYDASGNKLVSYIYDAYGNVTTTYSNGGASSPARFNPFKYRGYYHDSETGFYYVSSRYYDPEIGRFINADGFVSTGQDITGYNMFAYCGNNPVNRKDPTGQFWITALIVTAVAVVCTFALSSCSTQPTSDVGAASPYSPSNSTDYNCYAYALGEKTWKYVGGSPDAVKDFDVDNVAEMVLLDAKKDGRSMRTIDSYDSPIESNEYRIALRTGKEDYHFMVQHNDGSWSHKPGFCSTRLIDGANPSVISWDAPRVDAALLYNFGIVKEIGSVPNYYDSRTIYFAVSK